MTDHTEIWQLKIAIGNRIAGGTMTVEHLRAFVALSKEDLDRIFPPAEVGQVTTTEANPLSHRIPPWGLRSDL